MLGLKLLGETIEEVRTQMDTPLEVLGYCITMYDRRLGITEEVLQVLQQRFGPKRLETKVRVNSNLKAAPAHRKDTFQFEAGTKKPWRGVEDFGALAKEVMGRLGSRSEKAA
jgi:cellulose biosynthesis protein BcsQ